MRHAWWLWVLVVATSCDTLGEFNTAEGEVYRGLIVGVNDPTSCPDGIDCSFIRRGFPSGTTLDLTFDSDKLYEDEGPGTISTSGEDCGPTFENTPLLPIPPLAHDQLGLYEFPGGARIRNYMFVARPTTGPLAARDAMVFVSLIRGGSIEVRIIAGPGRLHVETAPGELVICDPSDCPTMDAGACDYFGFFGLAREQL